MFLPLKMSPFLKLVMKIPFMFYCDMFTCASLDDRKRLISYRLLHIISQSFVELFCAVRRLNKSLWVSEGKRFFTRVNKRMHKLLCYLVSSQKILILHYIHNTKTVSKVSRGKMKLKLWIYPERRVGTAFFSICFNRSPAVSLRYSIKRDF